MTFAALLLAGGESRRMGRDKGMLEFGGRPLWERQLKTLRALSPEKTFVAARTAPSWLPQDVGLVLDDPPSRGPLSGLAKALAEIETTHLVVLAVDMPLMTANELKELLERATPSCGVVPVIAERAEPLAAVYPANAAPVFKAALIVLDFSLQRIVRALAEAKKVKLWSVPEPRMVLYRSLNTPSDFKL